MRYKLFNILPITHFKQLETFLISLCVIISIFIAAIFFFLEQNTSSRMHQRVREQAIAYLDLLNHTKQWNYNYGGVYVVKGENVKSNVYLEKLGIEPDIRCVNGKVLTIRNHAIMASEISRRSEHNEGVKFRLVSLKPLDPANTPDQFERASLEQFANGRQENSEMVKDVARPVFRYISPLLADASCMECHGGPGVRQGDVLGAVSITVPIAQILSETRHARLMILISALALIGFMIAITYFMTLRLAIDLGNAQSRLQTMALTDELTGLNNRRQVMARLEEEFQRAIRLGESICLISLDIDHFKRINDTYGHPFGDKVLKQIAATLEENVRPYDVIGRIGGEEFLIVAPASPAEDAVVLADRIITAIRKCTIEDGPTKITVTASAGVAVIKRQDADIDEMLRRADRALYQAKAEGRNRVAGP